MVDEPENLGPSAEHDRPFRALREHVARMGALSLSMVEDGAKALLANDATLARKVIDLDGPLDKFDIDIETETIRLIATHQPEGSDLRMLAATLKIGNDLDRIGRLGYDLARNLSAVPDPVDPALLDLIRDMDSKARAMVRDSIDAFVQGDTARAKCVIAADDAVDALQRELQRRIFLGLVGGRNSPERLARTLLAARHLERVADNACKIAEKTVYAITGERRPEYFPPYPRPPAPEPASGHTPGVA